MPRLRWAVSASERNTASSTASRRPAAAEKRSSTNSSASAPRCSTSRPDTVMAPAFTMGLKGRLVLASKTMALKASPEGSTPTRESTLSRPATSRARQKANAFEIDWMVNATSASPTATTSPSTDTAAMPKRSGSTRASSGM